MPGRVGQSLAQCLQQVLGHLWRDPGVEAAVQAQGRRVAEGLGHLVGDRHDLGPQARAARLGLGLEAEDGGADVMDGVVQGVDGLADPLGPRPGRDHARRGLQGHAGGEQPLDDQVMQVAGDPVPAGEHRDPLGVAAVLG